MPRDSVRKALVIGSGAIKIAEAAEFDYSGSQALKALREEGIETVLVNPNVATIQTSHEMADRVYLAPLTPSFVEEIIERETPDAILLGFGGQTALSLGVELWRKGVLARYGVRVLGTPVEGIERALSREKFRETMRSRGLPIPPSSAAHSVEEALEAAEEIGYPVIVRVSFNLGGRGSLVAWGPEQLRRGLLRAFAHSEVREVLVEKYLNGWKEVEFEVVRDGKGNSVAVACLENVDPMGVHTGDSIVVAPCQTLTDKEYQEARIASMGVADAILLVGEGNVQLALGPHGEGLYIIETNPRMSRSSALASKATGYPLAYIAAKIALGYTLDEILNRVTGVTCSCFEPSLDYIVVKVPRWDTQKFDGVDDKLTSEMKSIGEVMAIGRNLEEALQKAFRMLDIGEPGLVGGPLYREIPGLGEALEAVRQRKPYWPIYAAKALELGANLEELSKLSGVDPYYFYAMERIVQLAQELSRSPGRLRELVGEAKRLGFSDAQIAALTGLGEDEVRRVRLEEGVASRIKNIDTVAAEWPAQTNYLYTTYNASASDEPRARPGSRGTVLVLGAGVFRIGVSVEFDWATVNFAQAARRRGFEVAIVNYNPETVSTDWDMSDKLYFEEVSYERILDIYEAEKPVGVVAFAGGQVSNNLARRLEEAGVRLLGTSGRSVDMAEDRAKFSALLEALGIRQPEWVEAWSASEAVRFAEAVGYPVIVRPSYVLSGSAMSIAWSQEDLVAYLAQAARVSREHPVIVSKFLEGAQEAEIDGVGDGRSAVGVIIEHIEEAGVHSGDSTMVTPTRRLPETARKEMVEAAVRLVEALRIRGPFNLQFLVRDGKVYVLELNLRSSRSMPFSSKSRGVNLMDLAARVVFEETLGLGPGEFHEPPARAYAVKTPQFSWAQLPGAYPHLGPEMRSTGEVAVLSTSYHDALVKSWIAAQPNRMPGPGEKALVYTAVERHKPYMRLAAEALEEAGVEVCTLEGGEVNGFPSAPRAEAEEMLRSGAVALVATSGRTPLLDRRVRRLAADLRVPLILDARLAAELTWGFREVRLRGYEPLRELGEYWAPPRL